MIVLADKRFRQTSCSEYTSKVNKGPEQRIDLKKIRRNRLKDKLARFNSRDHHE